ncbi:MAG: GTPase Era [Elusimicrobiales bacterium]
MSGDLQYKAGFVSIAGLPNAGKSTLINSFCQAHIAAVSPKPQTTRYHLKGIKTTQNYQIVFIDTPGFIKPKTALEKIMKMETLKAVKEDADIILLLVEPNLKEIAEKKDFFNSIAKLNKKTIITINKIDLYKQEEIKDSISILKSIHNSDNIIEISALKKTNIKELENLIISNLPFSPPYYYEDILSDRWERYFASEIIREEIFLKYKDEIPYSTAVSIETFKEDAKPIYIFANIYVSKKSHKPIIIGENGRAIKKLREDSEKKIESFLNKKTKLELFVKVRENWTDDPVFINMLTKDYK